MEWLNQDTVTAFLGAALASQVTQFGIAFSFAAFIHAGRMRKEIAAQVGPLTAAVNNLASALRQDLSAQSKRIDNVESRVQNLEKPNTRGG